MDSEIVQLCIDFVLAKIGFFQTISLFNADEFCNFVRYEKNPNG